MTYNYRESMKADIGSYIAENYLHDEIVERMADRDSFEEELYDELFLADSVTGNASGSYTFDSEKAKEYVLSDGLRYIEDAIRDFCISAEDVGKHFVDGDWEWFDVTIRCSILWNVLDDVLDVIEDDVADEAAQ